MQFVKGDLLDADTQAIVNTVNTVGVMGKGIALQFKEAFPKNYKIYTEACKKKQLEPGRLLIVKEDTLEGERIIINFPTKTEWFQKSKYEYIEKGLEALVKTIETYSIYSIAIPPLGCGNGGLKWEKVKVLMQKYLGHLIHVDIRIYEPNDQIKEILKKQTTNKKAHLTPARAMLLYAMFYYESLGENSSVFVANKLAYFLQRLGETNFKNLKFEASHYGPYTVQVEHLLHNINGVFIKGLEQMNTKAFEPIELQYDKINEVSAFVKNELTDEQRYRIKRLLKLVDGFQSAFSLEILATVDFVRKDNPNIKPEELTRVIHNWSERKKNLFQDKYISIAYNHLQEYSNNLFE